jgi:hypothetical protein
LINVEAYYAKEWGPTRSENAGHLILASLDDLGEADDGRNMVDRSSNPKLKSPTPALS